MATITLKGNEINTCGELPLVGSQAPDFKLTTKEEINMFIEADEDVRKLQLKIDYIEQTILFLDSVLRQINNRNYQIKNAIDWEKFQAGM